MESARKAFPPWKILPGKARAQFLIRLAELVERDAKDLASLEAVDAGILFSDSVGLNIPQGISCLRYYAGWADKIDGKVLDMEGGIAYTFREPLGVCAAIVPWNAPLYVYMLRFSSYG